MHIHLTAKSRNVKTGKIPVSTTEKKSCPSTCPFKGNGCYAELGHVGMFWNKVSNGTAGTDLDTFCVKIKALPDKQLWRHNQAGDLPQSANPNDIDFVSLAKIVEANKGKRGFTYTHYDTIQNSLNRSIVKQCNDEGFTVNLSANNLEHADSLSELDIAPVAVVLPIDAPKSLTTPQGRKVVVCPAILSESITCKSCQLCQRQDRKVIVGFPAHGTSKKKAAVVAGQKGI